MTIEMRTTALLPGIPVAGMPAAPLPHRLLAPGCLLLAHATPGRTFTLSEHQQMWGILPRPELAELIAAAQRMGLVGAGGAGFPTHRKLHSMNHGTGVGPVVVNGSEGETASGKDTVLLTHVPHLVLDGAVASARALGTSRVIVRIPKSRVHAIDVVSAAIQERHDNGVKITVSPGEDTFIAGEASAVISSLEGGPAKPKPMSKPPVMRHGISRRPVFLSNVETFARLALAARGHNATSSLITVSGAVADAGVMEVDPSTPLGYVLQRAGADPDLAAIITGGWHGSWLPVDHATMSTAVNRDSLRACGAHWGAGAIVAIPSTPCPALTLSAIADFLLGEGAGQCGPCVLGLAAAKRDLLYGSEVTDRTGGRGHCAHPTATIAALKSGQQLLRDELAAHARGVCTVSEVTR